MLKGKGWFIWQVGRCERGIAAAIADKAAAAGLTHVLLKVAERTYAFGIDRYGNDLVAPVAAALHERGIQVWGWHYVYGEQPGDEAQIAIRRAHELELDGYVVDAEAPYKLPGKDEAARHYMAQVRSGLPRDLPMALSSYRYPSLHRQLPWKAFLEHCDLVMPQVYWQEAHNPATQLARCLNEFARKDLVGYVRPVVPTGAAYGVANWAATGGDLDEFMGEAQRQHLAAVNFYSWDWATVPDHHDLWDTVARFDWNTIEAERTADEVVTRFFAALNDQDLPELGRLYADNAGHVTAERTRFGPGEIVAWYQAMLSEVLPEVVFTVEDVAASGNSRHARWTAACPSGRTAEGLDVFGILKGQIQYQYTQFTVAESGAVTRLV
jgi:ketosteroid isomerase-like protein